MSDFLGDLRDEIARSLDPLIKTSTPARRIVIIDPPCYPNVGDSVIFLGQLAYLRRALPNAKISFYDFRSYSGAAKSYIDRADLILLQGGGNFGDTWLHHHNLRLQVLSDFPGKRIIQFPQSVFFKDGRALLDTAAVIKAHGNFTMLVRDRNSLKVASSFDCPVQLTPDMAFALDPLTRSAPAVDASCLLRQDKELASSHEGILSVLRSENVTAVVHDWIVPDKTASFLADKVLNKLKGMRPGLIASLGSLALNLRIAYARERLAFGCEILSRGHVVVTDRLHGHVLATLLGIPNAIFDSSDGKVRALYEAWTSSSLNAAFCHLPSELPAVYRELRSGVDP